MLLAFAAVHDAVVGAKLNKTFGAIGDSDGYPVVEASWRAGKNVKQVAFPLLNGELDARAFAGGVCSIKVMKLAHKCINGELSTCATQQAFIDSVFAIERKLAALTLADDEKEHRFKKAPTKTNPERTIITSRNKPLTKAQVAANAKAEADLKDTEIAELKAQIAKLQAK